MARVLQHVASQVPQSRVFLSIPLEPNRNYALDWGGLDVEVQNSLMLRRRWKHRIGFKDELYVHVPHDTFGRLRRFRPDIVFSYELGFRSFASGLYRRMYPRSRLAYCVCVSEHTEHGRGTARWLLRKALVRMADAITYNGPSCERYLKRLGVPDEKLFPFAYAADDRTDPRPAIARWAEPNRRLLVVGQLSERKGILPLLDALSAYCDRHIDQAWDLTFIGTGPLESAVLARRYPANLKVNLRGHVSPLELASQWSDYGALVFPTLADEWGLVVNEAMRAGLPVIGSRYAQASTTLIEEGQNGWLYSPDQPGELHAKLAQLHRLTSTELAAMREHARSSVAHITSLAAAEQACQMFRHLYRSAGHLPAK
jgi:glycosyltransferase involved in cell wall biosynthesis